jgi:hypothetical protein
MEIMRAREEEEKIRSYNNRLSKEQNQENKRAVQDTMKRKLQTDVDHVRRNKAENRDQITHEKMTQ